MGLLHCICANREIVLEPVWWLSACIPRKGAFGSSVVRAITGRWIPTDFEFIRHRQCRPRERRCRQWRRMSTEPCNMGLACMRVSGGPSIMIFGNESGCQVAEPHIICQRRTGPNGRWMILVCCAITVGPRPCCRCCFKIRNTPFICDMLRCPQKLRRFQNHFDNMLITMPLRSSLWIHR